MPRSRYRFRKLAFALYSLGVGASLGAQTQTVTTRPALRAITAVDARWKDSFDAFAAADRQRAPQPGSVVFVGSSSVRLWDGLEAAFDGTPVVKRGFGGSRMSDVAAHVDQLVLPYAPRLVVVYAGDNDLAEGQTPEQVLDSFTSFVAQVRAALPETRIAYLSIKPSPSRATLMPQALRTNALIADYAARTDNMDYIDIYARMLGPDGQPRADLFSGDALHLNAAGYALWQATISPHLVFKRAPQAVTVSVPGPAAQAALDRIKAPGAP